MQVILKQDVEKIGKAGSIVKVKDGFARNFLFPNRLAVPADSLNIKNMEDEKRLRQSRQEKIEKEAQAIKDKLEKLSLTMAVLTQEDEKLYGSITTQEIASSLKDEGFNIDINSILLDDPIKSLGIYHVPVKLHAQVIANIKVWIVKK